jgi:hypothetical protein
MTAALTPARLASRALDGSFAPAELPALLARPLLFGHSGHLVIEQTDAARLFTWSTGRLIGVDGTAPDESLVPFVAQVAGERNLSRIQQRLLRTRRADQPLSVALRGSGILDPAVALAAEQAQARYTVAATLTGGDAISWFDRGCAEGATPTLDGFAALWIGLSEAYEDAELVALARAVEGRTQANDLGVALVRQLTVDPAITRLTISARAVSEEDLRTLGALVLCGVVAFTGEPVPPPAPRPGAADGAEVDEALATLGFNAP